MSRILRLTEVIGHDYLSELSDFSGTLEDLSKIVDRLKINYGPLARVEFDAGANNVSCFVVTADQLKAHVESMIAQERDTKQKRKGELRKQIDRLQSELDNIKE